MPDFFWAEQAFQAAKRLIGGEPLRLIENKPAVDFVALAARHAVCFAFFYFKSRATAGERRSSSMRSAASTT